MSVEILDDKAVWDKFIDDSSQGMLFHKWDFLKIIEKYSDFKLLPYGVYRGNELICVFPLFYKKTRGLKLLYSPPRQSLTYVPYLGPVMAGTYDSIKQRRKETYLNDSIDEMQREISRLSPDYTSISLVPRFTDIRPFIWNGYDNDVHYTYFIDLKKPVDELFNQIEKDCKKCIAKHDKEGFTIKQVNDVLLFNNIMKDKLSGEGLTYFQRQKPDYIVDVLKAYPENLKLYFMYNGDDVVSIGLNYGYKNRYILWMGGGVLQKNTSINDYFNWEFIKKAKSEGFSEMENWGADMRRLSLYKSKFNPSLDVCFTVSKKNTIGKMAQWAYGTLSDVSSLNFIRKKIY